MHNVRDLVCTPWDAGFRNSIHSLPLTNHSPSLSCAKRNVAQGYGPPSYLLLLPASLHPSSGMTSCTSVVPTGCPSHGQPNDKLLFFTSSPVLPPHPTLCFSLCSKPFWKPDWERQAWREAASLISGLACMHRHVCNDDAKQHSLKAN